MAPTKGIRIDDQAGAVDTVLLRARRGIGEDMAIDAVTVGAARANWRNDLDIQFYELEDETVWGATARILTGFLAHLIQGRASPPEGASAVS